METTKEILPKKKIIIIVIMIVIIAGGIITPIILILQTNLSDFLTTSPPFDISAETANVMIMDKEKYPDLIILDVRTQSEYDAGHINNSILIPNTELESRIDELSGYENTEIMVYCKTGIRSALATEILVNYNFTEVYNMLGGYDSWVSL